MEPAGGVVMSSDQVVVPGRLNPDGTIEVTQRIDLPPGDVRVTVQAVSGGPPKESVWKVLERIWSAQRARGFRARTREEIDAELNQMRDEAEEEMMEIERLQEELERRRRSDDHTKESSE
jgi:hypothetical protein